MNPVFINAILTSAVLRQSQYETKHFFGTNSLSAHRHWYITCTSLSANVTSYQCTLLARYSSALKPNIGRKK